ncbi:RDD family protein [Cellulomonas alba]|uniref:RDD family protein n=1 Tax=Cellulomonas alba TaxID=3053467 RepID=A0ABT7SDX2_9CELL|nr:RDD family protein [Cellulomonas alba]MDM7854376.1 RDD family protein [Cellulomonas alba]
MGRAAQTDVAGSGLAVAPGAVAPVGVRVGAFTLDVVAVTTVAAVAFAVARTAAARPGSEPGLTAVVVADGAALAFGIGQWIAEATTGATLGSALLRIRTVSATTGRPAGLARILLRQLVIGLGSLACGVGAWVVAASGAWDKGVAQRGWHDKAAGTLVLRADAVRGAVPADVADSYASAVARVVGPPAPPAARRDRAERMPATVAVRVVVPDAPPTPREGVDASDAAHPSAAAGGVAPAAPLDRAAAPLDRAAPAAPASDETAVTSAVRSAGAVSVPVVPVSPVVPVAPVVPAFPVAALRPNDTADVPNPYTGMTPVVPPPGPGLIEPPPGFAPPPAAPAARAPRSADLGDLEHTRLRSIDRALATPVARAAASTAPHPTTLRLAFDTGEVVDVTGDGLVGRNPAAQAGVTHLVAIEDPDRSVSKVHLAFGPDGDGQLWVLDRGSTNGTVLVRPDGSRATLPPGARAVIGAGWAVRFGERTARVEAR